MAKLFEPIEIRGMTLKNRILMAPMEVGVGPTGRRGKAFYEERAKGGVGAIIPGAINVDFLALDEAWEQPGSVAAFTERLRSLADTIHKHNVRIGIELQHLNRLYMGKQFLTSDSIGPSTGPRMPDAYDPAITVRELTIPEIEMIIGKYAKAAAKVKEAGFDFVELHAAHFYLVCQFFSPFTNHRTDKYGGDLQGRMRFGIECATAIRGAVGKDYPVFCRFGANTGGWTKITLPDSIKYAVEMERAGVDVLDVSTSEPVKGGPVAGGLAPANNHPLGTYVHLAVAIKPHVHIPVSTVGRIHTFELAEAILTQGKADLISIGRQLIADPHWPEKVAKGEFQEIIPCLSCNRCVDSAVFEHDELRCSVNFAATREESYQIKLTPMPKKVLVVGGGPAGMTAATAAALRGHKVTLSERKDKLGGQMFYAAMPPYTKEINRFRNYLTRQVVKASVQVKFGDNVTLESILRNKWDAVIIATGARSSIPFPLRKLAGVLLTPVRKRWDIERLTRIGRWSENRLAKKLEGKVAPIYVIGDCHEAHMISEAVADGARVGYEI